MHDHQSWRAWVFGCVLAIAAASPGLALAHHSFAMFDFNKSTTVTGVITEFRWANPHIHIHIAVTGANGQNVDWDIEGQTPNSLRTQGWSKSTLKAGDKVSLVIHPLKNGTAGGSLVRAMDANGAPVGRPPAATSSTPN